VDRFGLRIHKGSQVRLCRLCCASRKAGGGNVKPVVERHNSQQKRPHIHINGKICQYSIRIQVILEQPVKTGIFFKIAVNSVYVFVMVFCQFYKKGLAQR